MVEIIKLVLSWVLYLLSLPTVLYGLKKVFEWWLSKSTRKLEAQKLELEKQRTEIELKKAEDARREINTKITDMGADIQSKLMEQIKEQWATIEKLRDQSEEKEQESSKAIKGLTDQLATTQEQLKAAEQRLADASANIKTLDAAVTKRTIDQAEVEWAKRRNTEYEQMRDRIARLEPLEKEVVQLREEVAQLKEALAEAYRERDLGLTLLDELPEGGSLNG